MTLACAGGVGTAGVAGSPYPITVDLATGGGFNAANYEIHYVAGVLTVNPAGLTVTANSDSKTYGETRTYGAEHGV